MISFTFGRNSGPSENQLPKTAFRSGTLAAEDAHEGTREPQFGYGAVDRSIKKGTHLGRPPGCFLEGSGWTSRSRWSADQATDAPGQETTG